MLEHTPCRKELGNGSDTTQLLAFHCFEHSLPSATLHPSQPHNGSTQKKRTTKQHWLVQKRFSVRNAPGAKLIAKRLRRGIRIKLVSENKNTCCVVTPLPWVCIYKYMVINIKARQIGTSMRLNAFTGDLKLIRTGNCTWSKVIFPSLAERKIKKFRSDQQVFNCLPL